MYHVPVVVRDGLQGRDKVQGDVKDLSPLQRHRRAAFAGGGSVFYRLRLTVDHHLGLSQTVDRRGVPENCRGGVVLLAELSPKDRTVLYLHYFEGFSTQETGALLHISQSAVTTRLLRARQRLKEQMGEDCLYEA